MILVRLAASASVLLLAACDDPSPPPPAEAPVVYVGVLHDEATGTGTDAVDDDGDGGEASIALVVQGNLVLAYACGDAPSDAYPGWFSGKVHAGERTARLGQDEQEGWRLEATWTADQAKGTLRRPDGSHATWSATAARVAPPSGLYAAWSDGCMTGVIVDARPAAGVALADESLVRVRGTWCNAAGKRRQVTPLQPIRLVDDHLTVQVMLDDGPRRLDVAPVPIDDPE
jgi:hypothetical protein